MKKLILILLSIFILIRVSACKDIDASKENNDITNEGVTAIDLEKADNIIAEETTYDKISKYMKNECIEAFSPYYELLDFKISNYKEEEVNGIIEATFFYTLIVKNYDKDPDTVGYIKEAKESGNKNYQQMYDEYLQPREMNFDFKVIVDENGMTLYSNISPNGVEWEETKITDFILSE